MNSSTINTDPAIPLLPGLSVLVVGLGKTGLAAVKFFLSRDIRVSVSDSLPLKALDPETVAWLAKNNVPCETGGHSVERFTSVDLIFVSPGIPLTIEPLREARLRSIPVLGELEIVAHYLKTPAVGITGTNGKTTVTTLLGDIFRVPFKNVFVGGNIGTPLLDYVSGPQDDDIIVAEISSFQLDTGGTEKGIPFKAALLLNISPDHLERYTSYAAYVDSKFRLFKAQSPDDFAVLNGDDAEIMNRKHLWPESRKFFFGEKIADLAGAQIKDAKIILQNSSGSALPGNISGEEYDLSETALKDQPNRQNAAAAVLAARLLGCSREEIIRGLASFRPLGHRMTLVAEIGGVRYIDDSKATNVGAVYSAIKGIDHPIILIAGGRDKGGDYSDLYEPVRRKVKQMLLIGEARDKMKRAFLPYTDIETLDTLQEAVMRAAELAEPGDVVLLSPACASFDMFKSYAERGNIFAESVQKIKNDSARSMKEHLCH